MPTTLGEHPGPVLHRRVMTYMLLVPAREIGHPVPLIVQMKTDDSPVGRTRIEWQHEVR